MFLRNTSLQHSILEILKLDPMEFYAESGNASSLVSGTVTPLSKSPKSLKGESAGFVSFAPEVLVPNISFENTSGLSTSNYFSSAAISSLTSFSSAALTASSAAAALIAVAMLQILSHISPIFAAASPSSTLSSLSVYSLRV